MGPWSNTVDQGIDPGDGKVAIGIKRHEGTGFCGELSEPGRGIFEVPIDRRMARRKGIDGDTYDIGPRWYGGHRRWGTSGWWERSGVHHRAKQGGDKGECRDEEAADHHPSHHAGQFGRLPVRSEE